MQSQVQEPAPWDLHDVLSDADSSLEGRRRSRLPNAACVLVVEDDLLLAEALKLRFEQVGLATRTASSGTAASLDLEQSHFDAVVLDIGLPDRNGLELIQEVGARHVLRKPCSSWLLTEAVLGLVNR